MFINIHVQTQPDMNKCNYSHVITNYDKDLEIELIIFFLQNIFQAQIFQNNDTRIFTHQNVFIPTQPDISKFSSHVITNIYYNTKIIDSIFLAFKLGRHVPQF